jgi:DNA-binding response OmpR family regulator
MGLTGHSILVVEDEPLIAMDIAGGLRKAGALVMTAHTLCDGLRLAGHPDVSAAVIDFRLHDHHGTALCECLNERGVPFVLHTGYTHIHEACQTGIVVAKPAPPDQIAAMIEALLLAANGRVGRSSTSASEAQV